MNNTLPSVPVSQLSKKYFLDQRHQKNKENDIQYKKQREKYLFLYAQQLCPHDPLPLFYEFLKNPPFMMN